MLIKKIAKGAYNIKIAMQGIFMDNRTTEQRCFDTLNKALYKAQKGIREYERQQKSITNKEYKN